MTHPAKSDLAEEAREVRLAAMGKLDAVERGRTITNGRQRYPLEQIQRDQHAADILGRAADRLQKLAETSR